jgi:hypothetical protein
VNAPLRVPLTLEDPETSIRVADLCFDDLGEFVYYFWPVAQKGRHVEWGWHLQYICERIQAYLERGYGTLVICMPVGSGKSTIVNTLAQAWHWLRQPNAQWLTVSNANNTSRDSLRTRNVVSSPEYLELARMCGRLEDVTLSRSQAEKTNFENNAGGIRHVRSMGAAITGADADVLGVDDPLDANDVEIGSPAQVKKRLAEVNKKYDGAMTDRLRRRKGMDPDIPAGVRLIIAQRLALGDLPDMMIARRDKLQAKRDAGEWVPEGAIPEVIVLPEEFDPDVPGGVCPADPRTKAGELLQPNFRGRGDLEAERAAPGGERKVATRYNQRPTAKEGGVLKEAFYSTRYSEHPHIKARDCGDRLVATVDCAEEVGPGHDWTVVQLWGRIGTYLVLLWEWRDRLDITTQPAFLQRIRRELEEVFQLQGVPFYVEKKSNGASLLKLRPVDRMIEFKPGLKSKAERAHGFALKSEARECLLPTEQHGTWDHGGVEGTVGEWHGFQAGGSHDDRVDTAAMAEHWFFQRQRRGTGLHVGF